jgi:hypothetical protein
MNTTATIIRCAEILCERWGWRLDELYARATAPRRKGGLLRGTDNILARRRARLVYALRSISNVDGRWTFADISWALLDDRRNTQIPASYKAYLRRNQIDHAHAIHNAAQQVYDQLTRGTTR